MILRASRTPRGGTVLPLVTISMVALIAMLALAIDIGMIAVARCEAQNAADSAAMAGVRTINGDTTNNYNLSSAPGQSITAAVGNHILGQNVAGDPNNITTVNSYTYQSGDITVEVGAYAYVYNDANPSLEAFQVQFPRSVTTEPYSAVRATINAKRGLGMAQFFGTSTFNTGAQAVAAHRPRDVMIIMDLSGSMRFQSLPGVPMSGSQATASSNSAPRTQSMNPDTVFPQFGHYSDITGAALQGTLSIPTTTGEYVDPSNISSTQNSGPPVCADFYQNAVGVAPSAANLAFSPAVNSYATTPGGDDYLKTNFDATTTYAKTVAQFNGATGSPSTTTNPKFEVSGYAGAGARTAFNGYTQGPGYWGKTFYVWPPSPSGQGTLPPPSSLTVTGYAWHNNHSQDWRQRFFVSVNTATNAPSWLTHNTILYNQPGSTPFMNKPGDTTLVTENGVPVTYTFRINYAAILYWLAQSPSPFPPTLQGGRIRYYTAIPSGTDTALNNRWWTTNPASLSNDERFWKEYIDFVLGFVGTGANTYNSTQNGVAISAIIGNGDYYTWTGASNQITQRPQPQAPVNSSNVPDGPYETGAMNAAALANATSIVVKNLTTKPSVDHYVILNSDTAHPYVITAVSAASPYTLTISPKLAAAVSSGGSVQVFSPYMDYNDNPPRPRHQFWFGPMTMVDWLGNYNLGTLANGAPHHWWPGNCHEAHAWACKVGIQTAIADIKNNHPNDFVGLTFFSGPKTSSGGSGHHNRAVVGLGRNYQQLTDSLWFPPSTVTGGVAEIGPYDTDMNQTPRADGGTAPGMGFMLAYNQFSSSANWLRSYAQPQAQYRGDAGGLGRKGASRLIIFETDGVPNTRALATLSGAGADSYYPIRINNPQNLADAKNVEWPSGGSYSATEIYGVIQQIAALDTATPPGYGTARKPVQVHCIGYGGDFDPANAGTNQTDALTFLQTVQFYGNTSSDVNPLNFPTYKRIYGPNAQRITNMQTAISTIMQSGVQVSLLK